MTYDTMKTTIRQRILELIRKNQVITASEVSLLLDMTSANIRHHLSVLVADGIIEVIGVRKAKRGRPRKIYSLCEPISDDGLVHIMIAFINRWRQSLNHNEIQLMFNHIAISWAEERKNPHLKNLSQVLTNCIEQLNELSYHAHWVAGREGPLVRFDNCPYKRIIKECPELCAMDQILLGEMIGSKFKQIAKLEQDEKGLRHCAFKGY